MTCAHNANCMKVLLQHIKLHILGEDVCWVKDTIYLLELKDALLDQVLDVKVLQVDVPSFA